MWLGSGLEVLGVVVFLLLVVWLRFVVLCAFVLGVGLMGRVWCMGYVSGFWWGLVCFVLCVVFCCLWLLACFCFLFVCVAVYGVSLVASCCTLCFLLCCGVGVCRVLRWGCCFVFCFVLCVGTLGCGFGGWWFFGGFAVLCGFTLLSFVN